MKGFIIFRFDYSFDGAILNNGSQNSKDRSFLSLFCPIPVIRCPAIKSLRLIVEKLKSNKKSRLYKNTCVLKPNVSPRNSKHGRWHKSKLLSLQYISTLLPYTFLQQRPAIFGKSGFLFKRSPERN